MIRRLLIVAALLSLSSAAFADFTTTCSFTVDSKDGQAQIVRAAPDKCAVFMGKDFQATPVECPPSYRQWGPVSVVIYGQSPVVRKWGNGDATVTHTLGEARRTCLKLDSGDAATKYPAIANEPSRIQFD